MNLTNTVDVTALAAELRRAWVPALPPRPAPCDDEDDEDQDLWEGDDCGCGGEDGWGRPLCNCGGGCSCEQCHHLQHSLRRTCSWRSEPAPGGVRCDKPTRYLVQGWHPDGQTSVQAKDVDPSLDGDPRGEEHIPFDERIRDTNFTATACSQHHAYVLASQLRSNYNDRQPDPTKHYRFKIEQHRYRPHDLDLPEILRDLRHFADSLRINATTLVKAGCRVPDVAASGFAPQIALGGARHAAAELVELLAQLDTRERHRRRFRPGDPQPDGLRSVHHEAENTAYDLFPELNTWIGGKGDRRRFDSWETMLEALGEVVEWPRHELVLPGQDGDDDDR